MALANGRGFSLIEAAKALGFFPAQVPKSGLVILSAWQIAEIDYWLANLPSKTGYELDKIEHGLT